MIICKNFKITLFKITTYVIQYFSYLKGQKMTTLDSVKAAQLQARKDKRADDASTLTTLIGEAEMIGKNDGNRVTTDAEVVAVIKKFVKNIDETLNILSTDSSKVDRVEALTKEKALLSTFLPKQLGEEELRDILSGFVSNLVDKNPKAMGKVLASLKEHFAGRYDGALASKITKELLA